ncbi:MAG: hypothetical protein RL459_1952, partial [Pseudomonadota bacterium]
MTMNPSASSAIVPTVQSVTLGSVDDMRERIRRKSKLKGRQADELSLEAVRSLIGFGPHRRDLLIEHLHKLNDAYRCLHDHHLVALAKEMNISMAEVFEVATFYHHFEVVRGDEKAPGLLVRVCDGLSCELAGAQDLLARLPAILGQGEGADVRVVAAPCVGRCEQAPVAVVHQNPVIQASVDKVAVVVAQAAGKQAPARSTPTSAAQTFAAADFAESSVSPSRAEQVVSPDVVGFEAYRAQGGYALAEALAAGRRDPLAVIQTMEDSGLRGLG